MSFLFLQICFECCLGTKFVCTAHIHLEIVHSILDLYVILVSTSTYDSAISIFQISFKEELFKMTFFLQILLSFMVPFF